MAPSLLYLPRDPEAALVPLRGFLLKVLLIAVVAAVLVKLGREPLAGLWLAGALIVVLARWRRSPQMTGTMFSLEEGRVVLSHGNAGVPFARLRIVDIADVRLEKKTIRELQRAHGIFGFGGALEVDVARIVIDVGRAEPLRLTDDYVSESECVEWAAKIRSYLKASGWAPEVRAAPECGRDPRGRS